MKNILFLILIFLSGCLVKRNVFHDPQFYYDKENYTLKRITPKIEQEDISEHLDEKSEIKIMPIQTPHDSIKSIKEYDIPPKPKKFVKVKYPDKAGKCGYQGVVLLELLINKTGIVKKAITIAFLSHEEFYRIEQDKKNAIPELIKKGLKRRFNEIEESLVKSALEAAIKTEFTPAYQKGKPVYVWVSFPVRFVLR